MAKPFDIIITWPTYWEIVAGDSHVGSVLLWYALISVHSLLLKSNSINEATFSGYLAQPICIYFVWLY